MGFLDELFGLWMCVIEVGTMACEKIYGLEDRFRVIGLV